jgi:hypothetical protein
LVGSPVTFPPGFAMVVTGPLPTGSGCPVTTIGIADVARAAASGAGGARATMTSTWVSTSSAANEGSRSVCSPYQRPSTRMLCLRCSLATGAFERTRPSGVPTPQLVASPEEAYAIDFRPRLRAGSNGRIEHTERPRRTTGNSPRKSRHLMAIARSCLRQPG